MAKTYTVKWGDTLYDIAKEHNTTYQTLAKINGLDIVKKNGQDYVYLTVGQVIKLVDDGSSSNSTKVTTDGVKIISFGLQSNSDRGMYVRWQWDKDNTQEYKIEWYDYYDGYWHKHESTVTVKNSEFSADTEATKVKVKIKPVAKKYKNSNGKEVAYWTNVNWVTSSTYSFSENPPKVPKSAPSIIIENTKVRATVSDLSDLNSPSIVEFQLAKDDVATSTKVKVAVGNKISVTGEFTVKLGSSYQVRARTIRGTLTSAWTAWSEKKETKPSAPEITKCVPGTADNSVDLTWTSISTAKTYTIEYATNQSYFTNPPADNSEPYKLELSEDDERVKTCKATISDKIVAEKNFYFRIKAKNTVGDSDWSNISQFNTGEGPKAPTTFSSRSSIKVGETVTLNWTHNSRSNTNANYSHIDLYVDGVKKLIPTLTHDVKDTSDSRNEKSYTLNTTAENPDSNSDTYDIICPEGATLQWRVRTSGEDGYLGEWSALRTILVYADPELTFDAYDLSDSIMESPIVLTTLPLKLRGLVSTDPTRQKIIGYHVSITADKDHQIVDTYGETTTIRAGDIVYSQPFDTIDPSNPNEFEVSISPGDMSFINDVTYTATCTVTMSSGISVSKSLSFAAVLSQSSYVLDAEISVDADHYTATIRPYCTNLDGSVPTDDIYLYVYRREYNGELTLVSGDILNSPSFSEVSGGLYRQTLSNIFVTDLHPALDYARYRIVAVNQSNGSTIYADLPGYRVGGKSIILQWDETCTDFDATDADPEEISSSWSGEMLELQYNIDVTPKYDPDVALVGYIGRKRPVDYYGTQRGEGATWNTTIDKNDYDTLYGLRRLAEYMGSVYVREPSGTGYRAHVKVSFSRKHRDLTIPVTLDITRVEEEN